VAQLVPVMLNENHQNRF